jgi:hypothetical protein
MIIGVKCWRNLEFHVEIQKCVKMLYKNLIWIANFRMEYL